MKTHTLASLVVAVLSTTVMAAQAKPVRLIETSPAFAHAMLERYPDRIKPMSDTLLVVPTELVTALAQASHELTGRCGGFIDVTGEKPRKHRIEKAPEPLPQLSSRKDEIVASLNEVRAANIRDYDLAYTGKFTTRLASSSEGVQAPEWLRQTWLKMARDAGRDDIKVELLDGPDGYEQKSVRITIPGRDPALAVVVMGAHLDSINQQGEDAAPGQDDDASGIAALTEAYRVLLARNVHPARTIEIFGYSAEELGLLGSRVIAESYKSAGREVRAALQLDMVAWPGDAHAITFITDNVDPALTQWTEQLYGLYVGGDVKEDRCGYACSDHASWHRYGYPSVMPFESPMEQMNYRLHTSNDLWDELLNIDHAARFVKLALAFAAELSN